MSRVCRPLSDMFIKNLKSEGAKKYYDGGGLLLHVSEVGTKTFRIEYRFQGKRDTLVIGRYPQITLKEAREQRELVQKLKQQGINPKSINEQKRVNERTFEDIALEWFFKNEPGWKENHSRTIKSRLILHVFPEVGQKPFKSVTTADLRVLLQKIEDRKIIETAHRISQYLSQIYRYSIAKGYAEYNLADNLKGTISKCTKKHFAAITEKTQVGHLLRAIDGYQGQAYWVHAALKLAPYVFVRPGELRHAEWSEFDFVNKEWRIQGIKMKMGEKHIVPLSDQALKIVLDLQKVSHSDKYLFPSIRSTSRPMSDNTILGALRRMGYTREEMTGHGFRAMACTILNEQGVNRDWIERQLAHSERNKVRAAYNYAEFLPERKKMMQAYADHLDELRKGNYEHKILLS